MNEPGNKSNSIQAEALRSLVEPLLDLLADKIVERMNGERPKAGSAEKLLTPAEAAALLGGDVEKQISLALPPFETPPLHPQAL